MLEPTFMIRDLSQLFTRGEAMRQWIHRSGLGDYLRGSAAASEDPLGFMDAGAPERLDGQGSAMFAPLSELERRLMARGQGGAGAPSTAPRTGPVAWSADHMAGCRSPAMPSTAGREARASEPRASSNAVIDAREAFEARAAVSRMAAVASEGARFGPRGAALRLDDWRAPDLSAEGPLQLAGEGFVLWYRVDLAALAARVGTPPVPLMGRGLIGVCVGRYGIRSEGAASERSAGDGMIELTVVALVRGEQGPRLMALHRLVDTGLRSETLRGLAFQRPREQACIQLEQEGARWRGVARCRSGLERLEIQVEDEHWLNHLGAGALLSLLVPTLRGRWPVGGGRARFQLDPRSRFRLGAARQVYLPERLHQGLLTTESMVHPIAVMVSSQMHLTAFPGMDQHESP